MELPEEFEVARQTRRTIRFETTNLPGNVGEVASVEIRFASSTGGRPIGIEVRAPNGLRASDMRRLSWLKWFQMANMAIRNAEVIRKFGGQGDLITFEEFPTTSRAERPASPLIARPGRRGHDDEHYQAIARFYRERTAQGDRNPTAQIATSFHVSRSTAAGWVRGSRARGYLAPAQRGRAG